MTDKAVKQGISKDHIPVSGHSLGRTSGKIERRTSALLVRPTTLTARLA
jgi:hypothetical protein